MDWDGALKGRVREGRGEGTGQRGEGIDRKHELYLIHIYRKEENTFSLNLA